MGPRGMLTICWQIVIPLVKEHGPKEEQFQRLIGMLELLVYGGAWLRKGKILLGWKVGMKNEKCVVVHG